MAISAVALGLQKRMQPDSKLIIEVLFKIHPLDNVNYFLQTIIHNVAKKNQLLHKSECAKARIFSLKTFCTQRSPLDHTQ